MFEVHNKWWQRFVEVTAIERVLLTVGHCYLVFLVLCVFSELFGVSGFLLCSQESRTTRKNSGVRQFSGLPRRERLGVLYIICVAYLDLGPLV